MKHRLFLELIEIHAQLQILHQGCMDSLTLNGGLTSEYGEKALLIYKYEAREAEIIWKLIDLMDTSRTILPQNGGRLPRS